MTGVWVGGEERYIHFNSMAFGQGARAALPIYGLYMQKVYADSKLPYRQDAKFKFPDNYNACEGEIITYSGNETVEEELMWKVFLNEIQKNFNNFLCDMKFISIFTEN